MTTPHQISTAKDRLNLPWVCQQIRSSYWGHWLDDKQIIKSIENSLCFGVYGPDQVLDGGEIVLSGEQVAFARVITDKSTFSTMTDLIVEESLRNQGIGTALVEAVLAHPDVKETINVISTEDASLWYDRFGWKPCDGVLKRNPK